jgi:hypothetical protein
MYYLTKRIQKSGPCCIEKIGIKFAQKAKFHPIWSHWFFGSYVKVHDSCAESNHSDLLNGIYTAKHFCVVRLLPTSYDTFRRRTTPSDTDRITLPFVSEGVK